MPTYEYACDDCKYEFEEFQSITAAPLTECPECKGRVRRLISAGNGLIFKGSGFYITDYKNSKSSASPAKSSAKPSAESTKPNESNKSNKLESSSD